MQAQLQTTVVITAWGGYAGALLVEAVESVRGQDTPARIVVVDNASDVALPRLDSVEVVRSEARLRLGAARNLGLERVETPFVLFWDADDVMLPGTLTLLEERIASDPSLAAYGAGIVEAPSGERHRWPRRWIGRVISAPTLFALLDCVWSVYPTTGAMLMKTALVKDAGGYAATDSGQDWVLGVSLAFRGRIGWTERPGRVYRIHSESVLSRHGGSGQLLEKARDVRERLRADSGLPSWVRRAVPLIAIAQHVAIGLHFGLGYGRRLRRDRERGDGERTS